MYNMESSIITLAFLITHHQAQPQLAATVAGSETGWCVPSTA